MNYKKEYPDGISYSFWQVFVVPAIKKSKGNKCEKCGSKENLDLHHTDPKKEVSIKTLQLLCRKCHKGAHKK